MDDLRGARDTPITEPGLQSLVAFSRYDLAQSRGRSAISAGTFGFSSYSRVVASLLVAVPVAVEGEPLLLLATEVARTDPCPPREGGGDDGGGDGPAATGAAQDLRHVELRVSAESANRFMAFVSSSSKGVQPEGRASSY
ncbi:hypothetical protein [Streptomyces canus]|uniref:hypothetical protein n=1 Tax=Streptomyces canus TaxID=58343 RepID=UPI0027D79A91|nr:hypothetical protein [Streptomyces canus]